MFNVRILFAMLFLFSTPVMAEVSVLNNAQSGITLTIPDSWGQAQSQTPYNIITALAPDGAARVEVMQYPDARFAVYPNRLDGNVQRVAIDKVFWDTYWEKNYNNVLSYEELDGASLGRGFAGLSEATFIPADGENAGQIRAGVVSAGIYNNKLTTVMCSAEKKDWAKYRTTCLRILDSVDNEKVDNEFQPQGYYRNFMDDGKTLINGSRPIDTRAY